MEKAKPVGSPLAGYFNELKAMFFKFERKKKT